MLKKIFYSILLFIIPVIASGCSLFPGPPSKAVQNKMRPITINYWRVWDGPDDFAEIIGKYKRLHPNINIKYRKFRFDEYKQALIEAFATDRGPDILSIHNTWMREYQGKGLLSTMPAKTTMVFPRVQGNIKKEVVYDTRTQNSPTPTQIKNEYIDTVYGDVVIGGKIYGLPLGIDTLAMFYNRDLFNNAGITAPPEHWNREFQQAVKKLSKQNNKGEIIQSGVALGGGTNIERSIDILSVLMMQNGTVMMENGAIKFHQSPPAFRDRGYNPGLDALRFYTDFANPAKEVYSWNSSLDSSLDMFINNKLAIMFGYSYMLPIINARAPKLNYVITKLPQIEGNQQSVNYANYWVETVANKSTVQEEAWDFIKFAANKNNVQSYLNKTKKPTALRGLIDKQKESESLKVFVDQVLTAKSWYRGADALAAETIFMEMIENVVKGKVGIPDAINMSAKKIQQTVK